MTRRAALPLTFALLLAGRSAHALDVMDLVRHAAEKQKESELRGGIAFHRVEVDKEFDSKGRFEKSVRRLYAVVPDGPDGTRRDLVEVDGRPATEAEKRAARKEDDKRRRARKAGDARGSDQDELMSGRPPLLDLLTRLDFELVGEDVVEGRPNHVVAFRPKPGLTSKTVRDRVLNNFAGRAWIDAGEQQVTRIDGHLTQPVKVLGGLALDLRDVRIVYEERPTLPPAVWAPCREEIQIRARAGIFITVNREIRLEFSGYRNLGPEPGPRIARAGR